MDGVHKLIEMLEQRFGKFWADALLLSAVLGAAAWGIHSFVLYLVLPAIKLFVGAYGYISGAHVSLPGNINEIAKDLSTAFSILVFAMALLQWRTTSRLRRSITSDKKRVEKLAPKIVELVQLYEKREEDSLRTIEELKEQNAALVAANNPVLEPR